MIAVQLNPFARIALARDDDGRRMLTIDSPENALMLARSIMEAVRPAAEDRAGLVRKDAKATSRAAALAVMPATGTQRRKVLDAYGIYGPLTDEELADRLSMHHNSIRPRRVELIEGGYVVDTGLRRKTRSGNEAIVWGLSGGLGVAASPLFDKD